MSDSITVRVTLDAYDMASTGRQTQVYVQVPEVARASWLLSSDLFHRLKDRPWPEVLDVVHEYVTYGGLASNSSATAAWAAVRKWLSEDANRDEMQAAFEEHEARQHPVARKLLKDNERLRARIAELEALVAQATEFRLWEPGYGLYIRRAPGAQGFAVMEARRSDKGRRAWTTAGWQYSAILSDSELFCWPDAAAAMAEARRVMPGAVVCEEPTVAQAGGAS